MKNAKDAIGIHPKVASKLSGADFDGDTVLVIPNRDGLIRTSPSLKALKDFDPKEAYPAYPGMSKMSPRTKQLKMGDVSNLITDMTIKGANEDEIARAVRHSMVVIDAEKHNLNYKQSAIDNNIANLKLKYQGGERAGSATLISRASSEVRVDERKDRTLINKRTGEKVYIPTGATYVNQEGKTIKKQTASSRMAEAKDAKSLSSGTRMESVYAEHANALKAMANEARKQLVRTDFIEYSPSARNTYAREVESLKAKLAIAYRNKPLERQAQLLANKVYQAKRAANPDMDAADIKKVKGMALVEARLRTGASKQKINITDSEWNAIQMGAISTNALSKILLNTDLDALKERAMPRTTKLVTPSKILKAKSMLSSGYTQGEVASALGISTTTLSKALE